MAKNRFGSPGIRACVALLACAPFVAAALAAAEAPVIPQYGPDKHEGVSSCDGSTCHGSAAPRNDRNVRQDEVLIWSEEDRHSQRAYKVLLNRDSKRISKNLGRKKPPHQDDLCLDCHADNPPLDKRRTENGAFRVEDGVGCEGCHGGAERWLRPHDSGISHAKNVELGMYPTDEPVARTRLRSQSGAARRACDRSSAGPRISSRCRRPSSR